MSEYFGDFYDAIQIDIKDWLETPDALENKWRMYIEKAPDLFLLICKLTMEEELPMLEKARLSAALAYFVAPDDLIPEETEGIRGYLDDIVLTGLVLNGIRKNTGAEIIRKHWSLEKDVVELVNEIVDSGPRMVGQEIYNSLEQMSRPT